MQMATFAAIDIGTYDVFLEIFEISRKQRIRSIDKIRHRIELGKDTYTNGKISPEMEEELCSVLGDFVRIMDGYKVNAYRAVATSSLREAENSLFILGKIRQLTGLKVTILSNSEQRFLGYKALATMETDFNKIIEKGTAIVDLDGGSVQLSLFDKDALVTTQNLRMGSVRIQFDAVGVGKAEDISGVFDNRQLHSQADSKERKTVFSCIADCHDLAFDPAAAKASRYEKTVDALKQLFHILRGDLFRIDPSDGNTGACCNPAMFQSFHDTHGAGYIFPPGRWSPPAEDFSEPGPSSASRTVPVPGIPDGDIRR